MNGADGWEWRFVTGGVFDGDNAGNVFKWAAGEPQGLDLGLCVYVGYEGNEMLDDFFCDHDVNKIYGLCEIPVNT